MCHAYGHFFPSNAACVMRNIFDSAQQKLLSGQEEMHKQHTAFFFLNEHNEITPWLRRTYQNTATVLCVCLFFFYNGIKSRDTFLPTASKMGDHMMLSALITCGSVMWLRWLICCIKEKNVISGKWSRAELRLSLLSEASTQLPGFNVSHWWYQCWIMSCLWSCKPIWQGARGPYPSWVCLCACLQSPHGSMYEWHRG